MCVLFLIFLPSLNVASYIFQNNSTNVSFKIISLQYDCINMNFVCVQWLL